MKKYLTYVCTSKYHPNDEFTLYARIIEEKDEKITFETFMRWGKLNCGIATILKKDFWAFYRKCTPEEVIVVE